MGEVISLDRAREQRRGTSPAQAPARGGPASSLEAAPRARRPARSTFSFDLALPGTYLAAERVDRIFPDVTWEPASVEALRRGAAFDDAGARAAAMEHASDRAAALSVPLVWPEAFPADVRAAMRVAHLASSVGRGAAFVLAAGRLAFCGGFDLGDPEVLAEAAAAADLPLDLCLDAAHDVSRDGAIEDNGRRLLAQGADRLPALRVGRLLFPGEERLAEAAAALRATG